MMETHLAKFAEKCSEAVISRMLLTFTLEGRYEEVMQVYQMRMKFPPSDQMPYKIMKDLMKLLILYLASQLNQVMVKKMDNMLEDAARIRDALLCIRQKNLVDPDDVHIKQLLVNLEATLGEHKRILGERAPEFEAIVRSIITNEAIPLDKFEPQYPQDLKDEVDKIA